MSITYQIEPMPRWPYPETKPRQGSLFRATYTATMATLTRELTELGVRGAVAVRLVVDPADVRRDGALRSRANVTHPGVALSFESKYGPLTYPCDTFKDNRAGSPDWHANLRAIALGLEHLRVVNRYGIAGRGEQYQGWRAITSGSNGVVVNTEQAAREFLRSLVPNSEAVPDDKLAKMAARRAHPDTGGSAELLMRVLAARNILLGAVSHGA